MAMSMAESWTISAGGQVYGPYSLEQMQAFHAEKRLAAHSLIARAGEEQFHHANEDPEFAALFQPAEAPTITPAQPAAHSAAHSAAHGRFGARADGDAGSPGHFVIIAEMKSGSTSNLEEVIFSLGVAHQFGPQAWVLSSSSSINAVRTALVQKLGKHDTLFIVDSAHDKVAWFNFGPETDARIRKMWSRPTEHAGPEKQASSRT